MSKQISATEAAEFLRTHDKYLILTHAHPDGDTLGSAFALCSSLRSIGKSANVICPDLIPSKFEYLTVENDPTFEPETVVSVDVADKKLLGNLCEQYGDTVQLSIDHHATNTGFAELLYLEGDSAAASECVYKVIKELCVTVTPFIADCLYTGMATDTGCFKFSNTTPCTHTFAAELMQSGANYVEINRVMFEVKTRERLEMERRMLDGIEYLCDGQCAVITVTQSIIKETGCDASDIDGISSLPRQIEGVKIGVTIREKSDGRWKVSLRTHEPYDASEICANFGGGGHKRAAGCEFGCEIGEVKQRLKSVIVPLLQGRSQSEI